jgi:hypothetical protein
MSDFRIESSEERRGRYMRLARAASEAAAKSPLPAAKEMYVKLAQAWVSMADGDDRYPDTSYDDGRDSVPQPPGLNVKLNGIP